MYQFNISCLRFFTDYGPRQRPDLAIHKFSRLIDNGEAIPVFGDGSTARYYTYVDDITAGISLALDHFSGYRVYNLGESRAIKISYLIKVLEEKLGRKAVLKYMPMQAGDVNITFADIGKARREINFDPRYSFEKGIENFVCWYIQNKKELYSS
jgi:UDP-glucuronate 4-epimerase